MTFDSGGVEKLVCPACATMVTLRADRRAGRPSICKAWIQRRGAFTSAEKDAGRGRGADAPAFRARADPFPGLHEPARLFIAACAAAMLVAGIVGAAPRAGAIIVSLVIGVVSSLWIAVQRRWRRQSLAERALRDSKIRFDTLMEVVEDYAVFMLDPAGHVLSWNTGAERMEGWAAQEISGQHFSRFFPMEAALNGEPERYLAIAAAEGSFRVEVERVRRDGSRYWADVAMRAIRDEDGHLQGFAKVIRDITDRVHAASDRLESQWRMTNIIESAMDAIITIDADQRIVQFNRAAEAMFLCTASDVLGQALTQFIPSHAKAAHANHIRKYAATGVTNRAMGRIDNLSALRTNGEEFPIEASISQAQVDGAPLYTVILRDVTRRRRAEERQSLLLLELAHRVKNTLAIVQSVVAQTRRFASPDEFHKTLTGRLSALGAAHDLLTTSEWAGATLADVVRFAFEPYDAGNTAKRWTIEGPGIWLASNEAVTLSLVFHELATNAAKYGALSDCAGNVAVRWALSPDDEPNMLTIDWCERGGPPVTPPASRGFGSRLLDQAVAHELGGETILTFQPGGAACRFQLPLSAKVNLQ